MAKWIQTSRNLIPVDNIAYCETHPHGGTMITTKGRNYGKIYTKADLITVLNAIISPEMNVLISEGEQDA